MARSAATMSPFHLISPQSELKEHGPRIGYAIKIPNSVGAGFLKSFLFLTEEGANGPGRLGQRQNGKACPASNQLSRAPVFFWSSRLHP